MKNTSPAKRNFYFLSLGIFIGLLALDVLFLSGMALSERPIPHGNTARVTTQDAGKASPAAPPFGQPNQYENWVNPALLLLVFLLLLVPSLWIFIFHTRWVREKNPDSDDILAWLTSISVPYLILGFAMTLEFRTVIEDPTAGIGAIAAIMVLYALSILASFLYLEVRDLKKSFKEKMEEANKWYGYSLKLSSAGDGQPSPGGSIDDLLKAWTNIYAPETTVPSKLRRNAIGTLLYTYIKEEASNAQGDLPLERIPESVWPWSRESSSNRSRDGVSFLITNVGYYANFLQQSANFLSGSVNPDSGVFLATITYAPPPLWWNWQSIVGDAFTYAPIEKFRETLQFLVGNFRHSTRGARVFRKVIIADGWDSECLFTSSHWNEMKNWQFIVRNGMPTDSRTTWLPREYYDEGNRSGALVKNLHWTAGRSTATNARRRHAYWIVDGTAEPGSEGHQLIGVNDYFKEYMHPAKFGSTEIIPISKELFEAPILAEDRSGLSGCSELLFFGACKQDCPDAWGAANPDLAIAVLTTMSPSSETLFVTAIWGEERLSELWEATSGTVKRFPSPLYTTSKAEE